MATTKVHTARFISLLLTVISSCVVYAHGVGPWGQPLDWHEGPIDQVIASWGLGERVSIEGKNCLVGGSLSFKVNDEFAFDIDETVWLNVEFYLGSASSDVKVSYDRHDALGGTIAMFSSMLTGDSVKQLHLPEATNGHRFTALIPLEHARFANLGFEGSDFTISSDVHDLTSPGTFRVCSVLLKRSYTTPVAKAFGATAVEVVDETGQPTPVRMGIYDSSGHLPLPSDEAITLRNSFTEAARVIALGGVSHDLPPWPVKNRSVFYTNGRYYTRLPVGEYELVVAKGPEYRLARQRFTIRADQTRSIKIHLHRWTDMVAKGWYSGEDHIHYARMSPQDDYNLLLFTQAEDLKVANILQFDNSAHTYLPHYDWKPVVSDRSASFVLIPGQESPRTTRFGHTSLLHINEPIRDPEYLLYYKAFEQAHAQGGLAGYAHAVGGARGVFEVSGMAIDVPFGLVDFAEIKTMGFTGASIWFDFLNLGYKVAPTAGTDYPFGGVPGTMRSYVQIDGPFKPQTWFDELKKGRTFVTSGPMLEFSVNGHGMGSELHVKAGEPLRITAKGAINPDLDALSSLELIEQGDVVKAVSSPSGAPELTFFDDLSAKHGTWFVLQARGKNSAVSALSAPIFVFVDGQNFWKRSQVAAIVTKLKAQMQEILKPNQPEPTFEGEGQEAFTQYWTAQHGLIKERIDQADTLYDDLVKRAADRSK